MAGPVLAIHVFDGLPCAAGIDANLAPARI